MEITPHISKQFQEAEMFEQTGYTVVFSEKPATYCVGIIDMVNSTKIAASLGMAKMSSYYQIFLNLTSKIVSQFGGVIIKNIGDCLLFYFPSSGDQAKMEKCFECALALAESQSLICGQLSKERLPCVNYRISLDFGPVIPMKTSHSKTIDMIGPVVNMCSKINRCAIPNGVVIGGDLFQLGKHLDGYGFHQVKGYSIGLKHDYPVYELVRRA